MCQDVINMLLRHLMAALEGLGGMINAIGQADPEPQKPDSDVTKALFVRMANGAVLYQEDLLEKFNQAVQANVEAAREIMRQQLQPTTMFTRRFEHLVTLCEVARASLYNVAVSWPTFCEKTLELRQLVTRYVTEMAQRQEDLIDLLARISTEALKEISDTSLLIHWSQEVHNSAGIIRESLYALQTDMHGKQPPEAMKALEKLTDSLLSYAYRTTYASMWLVQVRQLPGEGFNDVVATLKVRLGRLNYTDILQLKDHDLTDELKDLTVQRQSVKCMLRGSFLYTAFGVASTPFEMIRSCEAAITSFD
jgi:hypothetical protein